MEKKQTASEILQKHEDANEMHLHHVDRKWVFEAMEEYSNICNQRLKTLAKLLAKSWFYGEWEWENPNERIQQMIMQDLGYYPFKDEDEMIRKTRVDEDLYKEAVDKVPLRNPRTLTPIDCHNSSDICDKEKTEIPIIPKISDEELFNQSILAMEEMYGSGCDAEIDAYFRGAKWMQKQFKGGNK